MEANGSPWRGLVRPDSRLLVYVSTEMSECERGQQGGLEERKRTEKETNGESSKER